VAKELLGGEREDMSGGKGKASACCASATLDEEIEDIPRGDEEEEEEEEEPPFTEEEVSQMHDEIRELAQQMYTNEDEYTQFLNELDGELAENKDLQEQGHILLDVLEYLQSPEGEEGEEGEEGQDQGGEAPTGAQVQEEGDDEVEPYPGEEGLQELWTELKEVCSEDDVAKLEEELEGKAPEEQWKVLVEVYEYLQEEQEAEQKEFDAWQPTKEDLEVEWKEMMSRVPSEDLDEVQADWGKASAEEKKQMLWDVRKLLDQEEEEEEVEPEQVQRKPPPPSKTQAPPSGAARSRGFADEEAGKSEVRRRGGTRRPEHESDLEYDFERAPDGGDWDEYYNKEVRRSKGGRSFILIGGALLLMLLLALLLTATLLAAEDQSVMQSAMGLLGLTHYMS